MTATAEQWSAAIKEFGVYPNAAGEAYPDLTDRLLALYSDRVAALSWVPSTWLDGVRALAALPSAPVVTTPYRPIGGALLTETMPAWVTDTTAHADAWAAIAVEVKKIVKAYTDGKIEEGRTLLDKLNADAAFWAKFDDIVEAIADAPANAVSGILGGAQRVLGGIFGSLFKSWIFWLALAAVGGYFAWSFGLLKKRSKG